MGTKFLVLIISMLPLLELRGSIPFGLSKGLSLSETLFLSLVGNIGVSLPLLFFFSFLIKLAQQIQLLKKVLSWWFNKIEKKRHLIEKYGFWGLLFFVAVPLPGSGAWSGCLAAVLFEIKFRKAFLAIALGVLAAAILVGLISRGALDLVNLLK